MDVTNYMECHMTYTEKKIKCETCGKDELQTFTETDAPFCDDCRGTKCSECCRSESE